MSRTRERPGGTSLRSTSCQLPLFSWLAISARSAAVQPARSSRRACLRVFGSAWPVAVATRAQPVLRKYTLELRACVLRVERSAAGCRFRSGSASSATVSPSVVDAGISVEVAGAGGACAEECDGCGSEARVGRRAWWMAAPRGLNAFRRSWLCRG
eukprot:6187077-Pleurochrysis_carterae.AAC.1